MKSKWMFICLVVLCYSCITNDEIHHPAIPDPEGTIALDMSSSSARIDGRIFLEEGNFAGALFTSIGKVRGLSDVTTIPKTGWVTKIAAIEGHGYVAYYNNQYWRLFVNAYNSTLTGTVRAIVKFQRPFPGSEKEIKLKAGTVTIDENVPNGQLVAFANESLFPFTVTTPQTVNWCTAFAESSDHTTPPNSIRITVREKNPTMQSRECIVVVKSDIDGKEAPLKVVQGAGESWITTEGYWGELQLYNANSQTVQIRSNDSWTATSNANWCTVSPNSGTENGAITISATANPSGNSRTAVVTLATKGNKAKVEIKVVQPASNLYVSRNTISFSASASQNSFTVSSNAPWTATSDKDWCKVTIQNNTVTIAVTENLSGADRNANVTVAVSAELKAVVSVTQMKPTISVSNNSLSFSALSSQNSFTVSSQVAWTATSDKDWCKLTVNNNTVTVSVTQNLSGMDRYAIVTVAISAEIKAVVTVTQSKPTLSVSRNIITFSAPASQNTFTVSSNAAWKATSDKEWCTVTVNNNTVTVAVTQNLSGIERNATVTVSVSEGLKATVSITQASYTLSISKNEILFSGRASSNTFTVTSGLPSWTVSSNRDWCTFTVSGNTVSVSVADNLSGSERTATIRVSLSESQFVTLNVKQEVPALFVYTTALSFPKTPTNQEVIAVSSDVLSWNVVSNQSWCNVSKSDYQVTVSVTPNTTGNVRVATITISLPGNSKTVTVSQGAFWIGDYYDVNGVKGVVYKMMTDGVRGMVVSMDETQATWGVTGFFAGATSSSDGLFNMARIKLLSNWSTLYPAFAWCDAKNTGSMTGWYFPATNEMSEILSVSGLINTTLSTNGGTSINTSSYWSSTESDSNNAYYGGNWYNTNTKTGSNRVRAVKAF